jgi:hypothetical protein
MVAWHSPFLEDQDQSWKPLEAPWHISGHISLDPVGDFGVTVDVLETKVCIFPTGMLEPKCHYQNVFIDCKTIEWFW